MIVFGLILVGLAVLLAAGVAASSGNDATLDVFGVGFDTRASVVFFAGVATTAALVIGLWLAKSGLSRGYRRRREVRQLRHQAKAAPAPVADLPASDERTSDEPSSGQAAETGDVAESSAAEKVAESNDAAGSGQEAGTRTVERTGKD
jgi:hypothetical protein